MMLLQRLEGCLAVDPAGGAVARLAGVFPRRPPLRTFSAGIERLKNNRLVKGTAVVKQRKALRDIGKLPHVAGPALFLQQPQRPF